LKNEVLRVNDSLPVDDQRAIVTPLSAAKVVAWIQRPRWSG
jgi:hypothetical protein